MKSVYTFFSIILLIFFADILANAQESDSVLIYQSKVSDVLELKKVEQDEIMVESATKIAQNISEAPNLINLIERNAVREYGFFALNQILWRQASCFPSQDYDRQTVGMRGVSEGWNNNHYLLMIDGLPFNENFYGTAITWEATPLFWAKNIEFLRGAGSALYGTNAMNGLVNVQTVSPADLKNKFQLLTRAGNNGMRILDALLATENNRFNLIFSYNNFNTSGNNYETYDNSGRIDENGILKKFYTRDRRSSDYFFTKVNFKGKLDGFSLQHHLQKNNYETGLGWLFVVPDRPEDLYEIRNMLSISYKTPSASKKLKNEISAVYQKKYINWNLRMVPDSTNSYGIFYPLGLTEIINTDAQSLFLRAQSAYTNDAGATFLGGFEGDFFLYKGDRVHLSNVDLMSSFETHPENQLLPMPGFLEYGEGHLKQNYGVFMQYISPKWFDKLTLTAGARIDYQQLSYTSIKSPEREKVKKTFSQFNPRLSLVYEFLPDFFAKMIAGRAFRAPAPTEIFGANTVTLASNIEQLKPETMNNAEFVLNWTHQNRINVRFSGFYSDFRDIIAYSTQNYSLSTNIYSLKNAGLEFEADWKSTYFDGFANLSWVKRLSETIVDTTIIATEKLTWSPAVSAKAGIIARKNNFYASLVGQFQGEVLRRASDFYSMTASDGSLIETGNYRPQSVPAWYSCDLKVGYTVNKYVDTAIFVSNIFNTNNYLIKTYASAMDYRMSPRQVLLELKLSY